MSKKQIFSLGVILILALILPLGLFLVKQKQEIRKKATGAGIIELTLSPAVSDKQRGESFPVEVKMTSTQAKQIRVAGVDLEFNPNVFSISSIACSPSLPTAARAEVINNKIYLSCFKSGGSNPLDLNTNQPVTLGTFQATVKNDAPFGQTQISFIRTNIPDASNNQDLSDGGASASYTIVSPVAPTPTPTGTIAPIPTPTNTPIPPTPTPTGTIAPTPTPTGTIAPIPTPTNTPIPPTPTPTSTIAPTPTSTPIPGAVKVSLKVKFKGIDQLRPNQKVKVKIEKDGRILQNLGEITFSGSNNGIYQSELLTLNSNIVASANYSFLIKGPKHLQKRFPSIALIAGRNNLDFSNALLIAGDLPHPQIGQDGAIDSLDATLLVNCFTRPEAQVCLDQADLNLDNIVNSLDINLLNQALTLSQWEDE